MIQGSGEQIYARVALILTNLTDQIGSTGTGYGFTALGGGTLTLAGNTYGLATLNISSPGYVNINGGA